MILTRMLLLAAGTYLGIMVCVCMASSAYKSSGVLGLLGIMMCAGIGFWIADADAKKEK